MSTMAYQWLNIILLFSFLAFVLQKKLKVYFSNEREALNNEIRAAGAEHDKIQQEYAELQKSFSSIDKKISDLKTQSLKEIEIETHRIEKEAERVIQKMAVDGEARLKNEAERTKKLLEQEVFESALTLAKQGLVKNAKTGNQEWVAQMIQPEVSSEKKNYAS